MKIGCIWLDLYMIWVKLLAHLRCIMILNGMISMMIVNLLNVCSCCGRCCRCVVGDTFPVGCAHADEIVFKELFANNVDAKNEK
jgi:hypothetical protein